MVFRLLEIMEGMIVSVVPLHLGMVFRQFIDELLTLTV